MANKKALDFEEALTELEVLVEQMEEGDLSLEDSLEAFERGIKLTRECQKHLSEAEKKVKLLVGEGDQLKEVDFDESVDE